MKSRLLLILLALLTTVGVVLPVTAQALTANLTTECVKTFDDKTDYFPEKVTVDAVEAGWMTKDLALLVGPDQKWLTTIGYLEKVDEYLNKALAG